MLRIHLKPYFQNPSNTKVINALRSKGVNFNHKKSENINSSLDGETFVITGTLENMTRAEAQDIINDHGGKVTNSISKKRHLTLLQAKLQVLN